VPLGDNDRSVLCRRRVHHAVGSDVYHVLNRALGRATLFAEATDYEPFVSVLSEALDWYARG
jgi:hypothetical protein